MATIPKQRKATKSTRKKGVTSNGKARTKSEVFTALAEPTRNGDHLEILVFGNRRGVSGSLCFSTGPSTALPFRSAS